MTTEIQVHDSRAWTGDEDYVEIEIMPLLMLIASIGFIIIGVLV